MYEAFFGLRESPFQLTPDPGYLMLTPTHEEALRTIEYGLSARKGIVLIVGDAGTGKTTIVRSVVRPKLVRPGRGVDHIVYVRNPRLSRDEFYDELARGFALSERAATSKARFLSELEPILAERHARGELCALVIDEAQALPDDVLEEVRLLSNLESDTHKLLPLVLAGQPEIAARLNRPSLKHFKQRVALRARLRALTAVETAAYIGGRAQLAGGDGGRLFSSEAVWTIFAASRGIPRTIGVICDNALLAGFAADERPVRRSTVEEVCHDLELHVDNATMTKLDADRNAPPQPADRPWRRRIRAIVADIPQLRRAGRTRP